MSASGTLEQECSRISPEVAAAISPTRELWNKSPISGEATRTASPSSRPVAKVATSTVLAASSISRSRCMSACESVLCANTVTNPIATVPAAKIPTSSGPSRRPSTIVWTTTTTWQMTRPVAAIAAPRLTTPPRPPPSAAPGPIAVIRRDQRRCGTGLGAMHSGRGFWPDEPTEASWD